LGLGMLAGTLIGAAAVSGLHAQAKPPVYLVTEIDVTNPDAYDSSPQRLRRRSKPPAVAS